MNIRDTLERHRTIISIVCVIFMLLGLALGVRWMIGPRVTSPGSFADVGQEFYYVLETKQYFVDSINKVPPFKNDKGQEAVRAYYFSCGPCTKGSRFVGYYEKYSDEVKQRIESGAELTSELAGQALVSADGQKWFALDKHESRPITSAARKKCKKDQKLRPCYPE